MRDTAAAAVVLTLRHVQAACYVMKRGLASGQHEAQLEVVERVLRGAQGLRVDTVMCGQLRGVKMLAYERAAREAEGERFTS